MTEIMCKHIYFAQLYAIIRANDCNGKEDAFWFVFTYKNVQQFISDHLHHVLRALLGQSDAFHALTSTPGEKKGWGRHGVLMGSAQEGW